MDRIVTRAALALALIGGIGAGAAGPARAQEAGAGLTWRTRLVDAAHAGDWEQVVEAWDALREAAPEAASERLQMHAAEACYRLGRLERCDELLGGLLEQRADHIEALFLRARLRAEQGDLAMAKTLLIASARAGQQVMRDLAAPAHRALFEALERDPAFVLDVMRAATEHEATFGAALRDPFRAPDQAPAPYVDPDERGRLGRELARRLEGLQAEVQRLAETRDVPALLTALDELTRLLDELEALGLADLQPEVRRFRAFLDGSSELAVSLRLQVAIHEGNAHLRAMANHLAAGDLEAVLARHERVRALVSWLEREGHDAYRRTAEQLTARATPLAERARLLQRIESLVLEVSGIVVAPDGELSRAIVNDEVVEVGAREVYDPTGTPIPGLEVARITPSVVVFRYQGVEFVRSLRRAE